MIRMMMIGMMMVWWYRYDDDYDDYDDYGDYDCDHDCYYGVRIEIIKYPKLLIIFGLIRV